MFDLYSSLVVDRIGHLGCQVASVDEAIEMLRVTVQVWGHEIRAAGKQCGTNGLVRRLRTLAVTICTRL